jgi:GR25 family glycosyltransferase involved in LPS biosynthesis
VLKTPILFIVFNRPSQTKIVLESIKAVKPIHLFIAADGARKNNKKDIENCKIVLEIIKNIDWDCNVSYLLRENNLGCKIAVSDAINWFFENVEEGIILEDDCLPNISFFTFCENMLSRYEDDTQIMHIGGTNFQSKDVTLTDSYYYSRIVHVWGWASWKRAWDLYNVNIDEYTKPILRKWFTDYKFNKNSFLYWHQAFTSIKENRINTWDYQWTYALWKHNGLSIIPSQNLVTNIGFDKNATHTTKGAETYALLPVYDLNEIIHPKSKIVNLSLDNNTFSKWYIKRSLAKRFIDLIKNTF